ncbi:MAG: transcriptional regulator [Treponema sp.]|nr:transcriptional regulator [Treponema sp.]
MTKYVLLTAVVPHDKADLISNAANAAGSSGGTVFMGRRISPNGVIATLGLGGQTLDLVTILTEREKKSHIIDSIVSATENEKQNFGTIYSLDVNSMLKTGTVTKGEDSMNETKNRELITVILNKGYADDAMAAARKAGAGGGTVINARGTAREDDAKFFGMHIVPEKEMLMIVVEQEKKEAVLESIRTLPCLAEPGSGIAFCAGIEDFMLLGKKSSGEGQ